MGTKQRLWRHRAVRIALAVLGAACVMILAGVVSQASISQPPAGPSVTGIAANMPARYLTNAQGHWQSGDSAYDADTQAKLIALTNAYYEINNRDILYQISVEANALRAAAGTAGGDSLTDPPVVIPLGQKLEDAAANGELTKNRLLKAERPYVTISGPQTDRLGRIVTTYTFGHVDIDVTRYVDISIFGSQTSVTENVTVAVRAHYEAYFLYNTGWEDDCADAVRALTASGISDEDIGTVALSSYDGLIAAWNAIDLPPGVQSVPFVILDTDATPSELNSRNYRFFASTISTLQNKRIEHLILLGCNAGHLDHAESNPAAAFSRKITGGSVLSSDGTVYNIGGGDDSAFRYESKGDADFKAYTKKEDRENTGWLLYQQTAGGLVISHTNDYIVSIPEILAY